MLSALCVVGFIVRRNHAVSHTGMSHTGPTVAFEVDGVIRDGVNYRWRTMLSVLAVNSPVAF